MTALFWEGVSAHVAQRTETDAAVLVPFQEQHAQRVANTTTSRLLEPDQSLTEKTCSKISYSRQFPSRW